MQRILFNFRACKKRKMISYYFNLRRQFCNETNEEIMLQFVLYHLRKPFSFISVFQDIVDDERNPSVDEIYYYDEVLELLIALHMNISDEGGFPDIPFTPDLSKRKKYCLVINSDCKSLFKRFLYSKTLQNKK